MWVSKGSNAQNCLLAMIEKWCKTLYEHIKTGAVLTDFSQTFDCIDHNLLIVKLYVYGFEKQTISFSYSYLTKHKQRMKVDSAIVSWEILSSGVSQGFISGSFLFHIYNIYIWNKNQKKP